MTNKYQKNRRKRPDGACGVTSAPWLTNPEIIWYFEFYIIRSRFMSLFSKHQIHINVILTICEKPSCEQRTIVSVFVGNTGNVPALRSHTAFSRVSLCLLSCSFTLSTRHSNSIAEVIEPVSFVLFALHSSHWTLSTTVSPIILITWHLF